MDIELDFGEFVLRADLFETRVARKFYKHLPCSVRLQKWGNEIYGSIGIDLGEENPVASIPPGGIAYTNNGNYVCIFFGQLPAWDVEHIGQIKDEQWKMLIENAPPDSVVIREIRGCS